MRTKRIYCPVNGYDCPYYHKNDECALENPILECDDFAFFWEEDENYYDDAPRTAYDDTYQ